jgi:hypothetical protein
MDFNCSLRRSDRTWGLAGTYQPSVAQHRSKGSNSEQGQRLAVSPPKQGGGDRVSLMDRQSDNRYNKVSGVSVRLGFIPLNLTCGSACYC